MLTRNQIQDFKKVLNHRFSELREEIRLELLSSSGHSLLDEQALKAIRGAAPYFPLPDRLHISRLNIQATFEYRISPYTMSTFAPSPHEERL